MINADNIHEKTEQEVFSYLVRHIERQGPCVAEDGLPRMQHKGKYCPGGILLKDSKTYKYSSELEPDSWELLADMGHAPGAHSDLVESLQWAHDRAVACFGRDGSGLSDFNSKFREHAASIAKARGLKY